MHPWNEHTLLATRRYFFGRTAAGLGTAALGSLLNPQLFAADAAPSPPAGASGTTPDSLGTLPQLHFPAKAKRIIWLFMADAPSQMDLFDYKPKMAEFYDKDLPESVRQGQRLTTMTSGQARFPIAPSLFKFAQHGQQGAWISELLPHTASIVDDLTIVRSLYTEAINHDPAITYIQTGSQIPGRPSLGAWLAYGIGSPNRDLPAYVVLTSRLANGSQSQALFSRLWGAGFLPTQHAGVSLRSSGDPVLYLSNPPGVSGDSRRNMLDGLAELNRQKFEQAGDPEIQSRIAQYEMAFRMQMSVPDLIDFAQEPKNVLDMYGPEVTQRGSYAYNCLLARRLAERDVRFVQLFHMGWDHHGNLPQAIRGQCRDTDQATGALLHDLQQRGLLQDTLIVWGGEFGRTIYSQGTLTADNYGRDHHPRCFTMLLAGAGIQAGTTYGETDDYCYNIVRDPVHVHDLNATLLHLLGIDHTRLTYRFQGRDFRLTDIHGELVRGVLA